jgi:hypothetical protein
LAILLPSILSLIGGTNSFCSQNDDSDSGGGGGGGGVGGGGDDDDDNNNNNNTGGPYFGKEIKLFCSYAI